MAITKTVSTVSAGYTGSDILTGLGEALYNIGMMASATGWYDSFTDTGSSEVRIVEQDFNGTGATGANKTIYHAFFVPSGTTALYYTTYVGWNATTHECPGTIHGDMVSSFPHPDQNTSHASYYARVQTFANAADLTITALANSTGKTNFLLFEAPSVRRLMGFVASNATVNSGYDFTDQCPPGAFGVQQTGANFITSNLCLIRKSFYGGWVNSGNASNDWAGGASVTGMEGGSGGQNNRMALNTVDEARRILHPILDPNTGQQNAPRSTQSATALEIPIAPKLFSDVHSGDVGLMAHNNTGFTAAQGDTLVVTAGVEEYVVLFVTAMLPTSNSGAGDGWTQSMVVYRSV